MSECPVTAALGSQDPRALGCVGVRLSCCLVPGPSPWGPLYHPPAPPSSLGDFKKHKCCSDPPAALTQIWAPGTCAPTGTPRTACTGPLSQPSSLLRTRPLSSWGTGPSTLDGASPGQEALHVAPSLLGAVGACRAPMWLPALSSSRGQCYSEVPTVTEGPCLPGETFVTYG